MRTRDDVQRHVAKETTPGHELAIVGVVLGLLVVLVAIANLVHDHSPDASRLIDRAATTDGQVAAPEPQTSPALAADAPRGAVASPPEKTSEPRQENPETLPEQQNCNETLLAETAPVPADESASPRDLNGPEPNPSSEVSKGAKAAIAPPPPVARKQPADPLLAFQSQRFTIACRKCGQTQTETAGRIADHKSFKCSCCGSKIKVRDLHDQLEDQEKLIRRLANL